MIPTLLTGEFGHMQFVIARMNPPMPSLLLMLRMKQCDKTNAAIISMVNITTPSKGDIARTSPLAIIRGTFKKIYSNVAGTMKMILGLFVPFCGWFVSGSYQLISSC